MHGNLPQVVIAAEPTGTNPILLLSSCIICPPFLTIAAATPPPCLNAHYTMDGTESYINSGWIWPEGLVLPGAPPITSFTVTFDEPGTYPYICTVHPWMTGTVEVT